MSGPLEPDLVSTNVGKWQRMIFRVPIFSVNAWIDIGGTLFLYTVKQSRGEENID